MKKMNNTVKNLLVFSAGLVIGGFVSFRLTEEKISDKYETMMQAEIALLKARYDKKKEQLMRDVEDLGEESSATVSVEKKDTTQPIRKAYNKWLKDTVMTKQKAMMGTVINTNKYHVKQIREIEMWMPLI
jgi:hypothetical protein